MTTDTYMQPEHGWCCFHCGETFTIQSAARAHFGATPEATPGCILKIEAGEGGLLRKLRVVLDENARLHADIHDETTFYREYYAKLAADLQGFKPFKNCRSLQDVFNVYDFMEGRALAAEAARGKVTA